VIALDTNVLARLLVEDDREQTRRATALVRRAVGRGETLFVSDVVMCEFAWVLASAYGFSWEVAAATLRELLDVDELTFRDHGTLERALSAFEGGTGDFADFVIREVARSAGFETVATFDRALQMLPGFTAP
jgi:predicted nucleic-acid-binding protein